MELAAHAINFHIFRDVLFSEDLRFGLIVRPQVDTGVHFLGKSRIYSLKFTKYFFLYEFLVIEQARTNAC